MAKLIIDKIRDKVKKYPDNKTNIGGYYIDWDSQYVIAHEHFRLASIGFGVPHDFWDLGESIFDFWFDTLKSNNVTIVSKDKEKLRQAIYTEMKCEPTDENMKVRRNVIDLLGKGCRNLQRNRAIRVFEGFAGYGGASFGLKRLKEQMPDINYEVVGYSEIDKFASELFDANIKDAQGNPIRNWNDITKIKGDDLPEFDMFTGGFPCQPFSSAGMQKGTEDPYGRGAMLGHIIRILRELKELGRLPQYLLLENVKGFTHGKFQPIHDQLIKDLRDLGYGDNPLAKAVLNSKDYGIPQNRERLWMFAKLGGLPESFNIIPPKVESNLRLGDFLDFEPDESLYLSDAQIEHLKEKHKIESFVVDTPLCFDVYNKKIKKDGFSITITQPEHNSLRVIEVPKSDGKEIIRKMSIHEQFRLMGFRISRDLKKCEIDFNGQSYSQLSKRAGNGWDINLVGILLTHIFKQL